MLALAQRTTRGTLFKSDENVNDDRSSPRSAGMDDA